MSDDKDIPPAVIPETERLRDFLERKTKNSTCPFCETNAWSTLMALPGQQTLIPLWPGLHSGF